MVLGGVEGMIDHKQEVCPILLRICYARSDRRGPRSAGSATAQHGRRRRLKTSALVLTPAILLRACCRVVGTNPRYPPTRLLRHVRYCFAFQWYFHSFLRNTQYWHMPCPYAISYAKSGIVIAYVRYQVLSEAMLLPGKPKKPCGVCKATGVVQVTSAMRLCRCYAKSGTGTAKLRYSPMSLLRRARY
eukprot:1980115-Rhodomonas_salina.1